MPSKNIIYVYPDVAFGISLIMNLIILWGTSRLAHLRTGKLRMILGAGFGAIYSGAAVYPQLAILHLFTVKMAFATGMFLITFFPVSLKRFVTGLLYFFLVSFSFGGIFFGVVFLINSSPWGASLKQGVEYLLQSYFWIGLLITLVLGYTLIKWGLPIFKKNNLQQVFKVPVKVEFDNKQVEVEALLDTGNQLQDPISQIPVIVVEYKVLSKFLPMEMQKIFESSELDLTKIDTRMADRYWSTRFRIIPFSSLGQQSGMLLGFRPDQIEVRKGEKIFTKKDVIVGIYNKTLSPEGNYRALLHPDLLQEISA